MQKFFPALNSSRRLVDAAGMDELLELRGLEFVQVKHPPIRCAAKRNDEELWHLGRLLQVKCKETKPAVSCFPFPPQIHAVAGLIL